MQCQVYSNTLQVYNNVNIFVNSKEKDLLEMMGMKIMPFRQNRYFINLLLSNSCTIFLASAISLYE